MRGESLGYTTVYVRSVESSWEFVMNLMACAMEKVADWQFLSQNVNQPLFISY